MFTDAADMKQSDEKIKESDPGQWESWSDNYYQISINFYF